MATHSSLKSPKPLTSLHLIQIRAWNFGLDGTWGYSLLPLAVINGTRSGDDGPPPPGVVAFGGTHGNEFEGQVSVKRLCRDLEPEADYDGYRRLAESAETPIACGEQEATEWGFRELIERAKIDVLQPDLTRCGGFTTARKIVHMAELANVLVIPHSWSSDLLTAASLHLNAFQRRAVFVEFNTSQGPLSRSLVREPLVIEDGYVRVPQGPGLGVEVNEETIEKYRIA